MQILDRGVQAVARGAARCASQVLDPGTKRCCMYLAAFALEVSRDAVAAGEKQLVSCAAKQSKYFLICTVSNSPCGDLPLASWGQSIGVRPCRGRAYDDMLEAMARIAPPQPNEAMARIAPRLVLGAN